MFKRAPVQDVQPVTGLMSFGESASLCLLPGTMPFTIPSLFFRVTFLHHFHTFPRPSKFYSLRTFKHQPLSTFAGWICRCKVFFMKKSELEMKLSLHAYFIIVFYIQICYKCTNLVSSSVIFSSSNWCQCLTLNIEKWCAKQNYLLKKSIFEHTCVWSTSHRWTSSIESKRRNPKSRSAKRYQFVK